MRLVYFAAPIIAASPSVAAQSAPSPRHEWGQVSPDGKRLVFLQTEGQISTLWVANSDGSGARPVGPTEGHHPQWAGNDRLRFTGAGADSGRVFLIGIDGTGRRPLAAVPGRSPVLSPAGDRVAFLQGPWTSNLLLVARPDGSGAHRVAGGGSTAWNAAWSPNGRQIAYTYGDSTKVPLQVHLVNPDGTADRAVTRIGADEGSAQGPAWSPDGRRLAIQVSGGRGRGAHIWIVDLWDGRATKLSPHTEPYLDEVPSWFPDGRRLLFQSNRSGQMEIWTMNLDGTGARQVTGRP